MDDVSHPVSPMHNQVQWYDKELTTKFSHQDKSPDGYGLLYTDARTWRI